jgi:hypothetical protein
VRCLRFVAIVGMGGITEIATGSPGYNSVLPNTYAPLVRILKLNGYATAAYIWFRTGADGVPTAELSLSEEMPLAAAAGGSFR